MAQWDVFISYASEDKPLAQAAYDALEAAGLRCWVAFRELKAGRNYSEQIMQALETSRVLALVLTEHSNRSKHVLREVENAAHCDLNLLVFAAQEITISRGLNYFLHDIHRLEAFDPAPAAQHLPRLVTAAVALIGEAENQAQAEASDPEALASADGPEQGPVYGNFEVLREADSGALCELGRSPAGTTYKARDTRTQQLVALKVLPRQALSVPGVNERLAERVERAWHLRDARLAALLDCGEEPAAHFQAWPFVKGESLQSVIEREGAMEPAAALRIGWQIVRALDAVLRAGLIHGDLKPANILLTQRDAPEELRRARPFIKVVDLRLTEGLLSAPGNDAALGTVAYHTLTLDNPSFASPEKCEQKALDIRADFYSLGTILWYLLTGKPLFDGPLIQVMTSHLVRPPPMEQLAAQSPDTRRLLGWLLEKDRERRPPDPATLLKAIEAAGQSLAQPLRAAPGLPSFSDPSATATGTQFDSGSQTLVSANLNPALASPIDSVMFASLAPDGSYGGPGTEAPRDIHSPHSSVQPLPPAGEGANFQHYKIFRREDGSLYELGRGAMGVTYKAFDTNLLVTVALKVINSHYLDSEKAGQRFLREARAAAGLSHPNIASIFHLSQEGTNYFYAMEFIDGETVEAFVRRHGPLAPGLALKIALQVALALRAASRANLVHRDIKPANIMLVRDDEGIGNDELRVKVIDFGLARQIAGENMDATITVAGFVGTPTFASPEQLEEKDVDARSDIYSLGITIWYMLTGKPPFAGSLSKVFMQQLTSAPPFELLRNARTPEALIDLLSRMLAKDPVQRPQTPNELRRELEALLQETPADSPPMLPAPAPPGNAPVFQTVVPDGDKTQVPLPSPSLQSVSAESFTRPVVEAPAASASVPASVAAVAEAAAPVAPSASASASASVAPTSVAADALTFTACAPAQVRVGSSFLLDIWAHTADQRSEVLERAKGLGRAVEAGRKGPAAVPRGALLEVRLAVEGFQTSEPVDTLLWQGEIANACFPIEVPADLVPGRYIARVSISAAGVPVAKLFFEIPSEPGKHSHSDK